MRKKNLTKPALERRSYAFEVRAEGDEQNGSTITGRPIVYGSVTDICGEFAEIIEPGALDGADLTDVRFLVNHDINRIPLARSRNNNENSTMQLTPDKDGMSMKAVIDTANNATARELHSAVNRGDISGMSFMFSVAEDRWEDMDSDYPTRHIIKIASVIEVSAVTFPAYEDTEINARSGTLESARAALESARKTKCNNAPEGVDALELARQKILNMYRN